MIIKSISLTNFRNHKKYHLNCNKDVTLILGENGCGKTSVLEAIYILTRGKSFRATDPDIINRDSDFYRIKIEYNNGETRVATYNQDKKTFICFDNITEHRLLPLLKGRIKLLLPLHLLIPSLPAELPLHRPGRRRTLHAIIL